MITHHVKHVAVDLLHLNQVVVKTEVVLVPVGIPCHVAHRHSVDLFPGSGVCGYCGIDIREKTVAELREVIIPVSQVPVSHGKHNMIVVVSAHKREIILLNRSASCKSLEELGDIVAGSDLIVSRKGNEYKFVLFGRGEVIDSFIVSYGYFNTVGNYDTGNSLAVAVDNTL